jgi:hypothetical protein
MTSHTTPQPIDLAGSADRSTLALVLAALSVPGSILTWGLLPGGGFVWGAPVAAAAIGLGLSSLPRARTKSVAAVVIGSAMILMMAIWTLVEVFG